MAGRPSAFCPLFLVLPAIFIVAGSGKTCAQSPGLEGFFYGIDSSLARYAQCFEQSRLYLHVDKTVYSANEIIWFSAYLLSDESDTWPHRMLYAHLVRNGDDSLIRSAQYLMSNHRSHGDILIPNATPPGEYRLIIYTDKLVGDTPALLYQQRLQIRRNTRPPFALTARIVDSSLYSPDTLLLQLQYNPAQRVVGRIPVCQYELYSEGRRVRHGKLPLGYDGKAELPLPRNWVEQKPLRFRCRITPAVDASHTTELELTYVSRQPRLRFFPEGGSLVMHTRGMLAMELMTGDGHPLATAVDILADGKPLLQVMSNQEGTALAPLVPKPWISYTALLRYQGHEYLFPLPLAKPEGYQLQVLNGLATDTFRVRVARHKAGMQVKLLLHDFKQLFWAAEIRTGLAETTVPVPITKVPTVSGNFPNVNVVYAGTPASGFEPSAISALKPTTARIAVVSGSPAGSTGATPMLMGTAIRPGATYFGVVLPVAVATQPAAYVETLGPFIRAILKSSVLDTATVRTALTIGQQGATWVGKDGSYAIRAGELTLPSQAKAPLGEVIYVIGNVAPSSVVAVLLVFNKSGTGPIVVHIDRDAFKRYFSALPNQVTLVSTVALVDTVHDSVPALTDGASYSKIGLTFKSVMHAVPGASALANEVPRIYGGVLYHDNPDPPAKMFGTVVRPSAASTPTPVSVSVTQAPSSGAQLGNFIAWLAAVAPCPSPFVPFGTLSGAACAGGSLASGGE
ncbi:MAG: hypothetical protein EBZ67_02745 [Chitinophagia bacterium]|nr:hypothetical protein [Chitinophagia bacterium]